MAMETTERSQTTEQPLLTGMIAPEGTEKNEVDLWRIIVILIKYKIQIVLFMAIGLIIGIVVTWFDRSERIESEQINLQPYNKTQKVPPLKDHQDFYRNRRNTLRVEISSISKEIIKLLDTITENTQLMEITNIEYHYRVLNSPHVITTIKTDGFNSEKFVGDQGKNFDIVYTVNKTSNIILKEKLKRIYLETANIQTKLASLNIEERKNKLDGKILENQLGTSDSNRKKSINKKLAELERRNISIGGRLNQLNSEYRAFKTKMEPIKRSISSQIYFEMDKKDEEKIPPGLWRQLQNTKDAKDNKYRSLIKKMSNLQSVIQTKVSELGKIDIIMHIFDNEIDLNGLKKPEIMREFPSIQDLWKRQKQFFKAQEIKEQNERASKNNTNELRYQINYGILLISLMISFIAGLFSVYLRHAFIRLKKSDRYEQMKKELIEAIRYRKL